MDPGKPPPPSSAPENNGPMSPKVKIFNKKLNKSNFFCGKFHRELRLILHTKFQQISKQGFSLIVGYFKTKATV